MFKLQNIRFKDILDIDDILIEKNKITAVVGSSGGGKTTFLKLLNNMITADRGSIKYNNKKIENYDPVELRKEVVMLPQNPQIFKGTINDNFKITEAITEKKKTESWNYEDLLTKVSLRQNLDKKADKLSVGEKQRLALARVILLEPQVFLLDEPSSSLDEKTEEKIIKMVVNYVKENQKTLIMVTHNIKIAKKYADKIINIEKGSII